MCRPLPCYGTWNVPATLVPSNLPVALKGKIAIRQDELVHKKSRHARHLLFKFHPTTVKSNYFFSTLATLANFAFA